MTTDPRAKVLKWIEENGIEAPDFVFNTIYKSLTAPVPVEGEVQTPTDELIDRFAAALKEKLNKAREKYGYQGEQWQTPAWGDFCQTALLEHLEKGDPRDVAAYCAFMWHHGWSTRAATKPAVPREVVEKIKAMRDEHYNIMVDYARMGHTRDSEIQEAKVSALDEALAILTKEGADAK
jgi:hypothetical protein